MRFLTLLLMIAAFSHAAHAQFTPVPEITSTISGNEKPVELSHLNISVFVDGNIASTTMEMSFFNSNNRIMEGELNFPLANGVTVSRFALDVNGEMREGVVVDKEKATQAFEATVRQEIDPGLVEVTKGNNFKARVYPIPAYGYKKAIIAFDQELSGDDNNYIYRLPLDIKNVLTEFHVKVEVVMNRPEVIKSDDPVINLDFTEVRNSWISDYHDTHVSFNSLLAFAIPVPKEVKEVVTSKGLFTSDNYFYVNLKLKQEARPKGKPGRIAIVWDESASGKDRDIEKEISVLNEYFRWLGSGQVKLITFANTLIKNQNFEIVDGQCQAVLELLRSISYDGGTNHGAVDYSKIEAAEILMFTDGITNFGEERSFSFHSPVIAINSAVKSNHKLLEHFAMSSNGLYINANELTVDKIIERLTHQQKQFIRAEYDALKVKELYTGTALNAAGDFSCAGIMEGAKSELTLHFGYGKEITESRVITIDNTQSLNTNLGERIWAQKKLKKLLIENDEAAIKAHGKKFNLVTPGTSLIVLDAVEDYARYEIVPPKSLLKQYNEIIASRNQKAVVDKQKRIKDICEQFKDDIQWWENAVDYRKVKDERSGKAKPLPPSSPVLSVVSDNVEVAEDDMISEFNIIGSSPNKDKKANASPKITIKAWDSNAPYINSLKSADVEKIYSKYLEIKPDYENVPSFYFDVATYMFQKSLNTEGLRVISNLAEMELADAELLRTLGRKLSEFKFYDEAITVFEEIMRTRSFEPHSYIDLGLAYAGSGEYQKAVDNLYVVIDKVWDKDIISRFEGIEIITLHEINNIIYHHGKGLNISYIEPCLLKSMPIDMRIVIDWDANETDIDLWITDPRNEKCNFSNKETRIGGKISNDITQGYGPEEFRLKHAINGNYTIQAKFYGSRKQRILGKVTVRATVYTRFDTNEEDKKVLTLQLEPTKEGEYVVGEIEFGGKREI